MNFFDPLRYTLLCVCTISLSVFVVMDSLSLFLLCLEQGDRSLKEHLEEFLNLIYLSHFQDNYLCSFLLAGINTSTKAQLSGEGPRGSFKAFLEWLLVSCGSPFTVGSDGNDTSPTCQFCLLYFGLTGPTQP